MALSKQEQVSRIKQILSNDSIVVCSDCGLQYFPFTKAALDRCPKCNNETKENFDEVDCQCDDDSQDILFKYKQDNTNKFFE